MVVKDNGGDFEPIPTGLQKAICINVFDVGTQPGYQGGSPKKKLVILWEMEALMSEGDQAGKHFLITKIYTQSIGDKSNLGVDLESWRGRAFTKEEREGFNLDNIIDKPCQINIAEDDKGKRKVQVILPKDKNGGYWKPETLKSYVPKFVETLRSQSLPDAPIKTAKHVDDFNDDIPW
jgi:hypothetical protein